MTLLAVCSAWVLGSCAKEDIALDTKQTNATQPEAARVYDGEGLSLSLEADMLDSLASGAIQPTEDEGRALVYNGDTNHTATHFRFLRPEIPAGAMPVHLLFRNKAGNKFVYAQADFTSTPGATRALDKFKITPPASTNQYKSDKAQHNLKVIYSRIKGVDNSYADDQQVTVNSIDPDYKSEEWYVMGIYGGSWDNNTKKIMFAAANTQHHWHGNGELNHQRTLDVPYAFEWHKVDFIYDGRVMKLANDNAGNNVVTFKPQGTLMVLSLMNQLNGDPKIKNIEVKSNDFVANVAIDPVGALTTAELTQDKRLPWVPRTGPRGSGFLAETYKNTGTRLYRSVFTTYTYQSGGQYVDHKTSGVLLPRLDINRSAEAHRRWMERGAFLLWGVPSQAFPSAIAQNTNTPVKSDAQSPKYTEVLVHHGLDGADYQPVSEVYVFGQEHRPMKNGKTQELRTSLYVEDKDGGVVLIKNVFTKFVKGRNYTRIQLMNVGLFDADLRDYGIIRCYYHTRAKCYLPFGEPYTGRKADYQTEEGFMYRSRILPLMVLFNDNDPFTQVFSQMKGEDDGAARNAIKGGDNVTYLASSYPVADIYRASGHNSFVNPGGPDDKYKLSMFSSVMLLSPAWHAEYMKANHPDRVHANFVSYLNEPALAGESYDSFGDITDSNNKKTFKQLKRVVAIDEGNRKYILGYQGNKGARPNPDSLYYSVLDGGTDRHTVWDKNDPNYGKSRPALPDAYILVKYSHARRRFVLWDTYVPLPFRDKDGSEVQAFFEYFRTQPLFQTMWYRYSQLETPNFAWRMGYAPAHTLDSRYPCLDVQKVQENGGEQYARRFYDYNTYTEKGVLHPGPDVDAWRTQQLPTAVKDAWFSYPVRHR